MFEQSGIKEEFEALCNQYGLPVEGVNGNYLATLFKERRQGRAFTREEILADSSPLELAKMLKQLSRIGKGGFILQSVGSKNEYSSPLLVEVLKKSLEDALQERVKRDNKHLVLYKGFGAGGGEGKEYCIPYPEGCNPQDGDFSESELNAIIAFEEGLAEELKKIRGNKERWESEGNSGLPGLGQQANWLECLLPQEWNTRKKHCFIVDFLLTAGFLDFKGEQWKEGVRRKSEKEKDRMVRNWIVSYQKSLVSAGGAG